MYNLVLFCKSYIKDLLRVKILKESIDKFNKDNIPFYISCPKADLEKFRKTLITNNEKYEFFILTDEEILKMNNIKTNMRQNWRTQQIIKLGFYKMNFCNHYAVFDSDCYFIQNFNIDNFMYDENTPYFCLREILAPNKSQKIIQNYIKRKGKSYDFTFNSQVFSKIVLENMEKNLLKPNNFTLENIIEIHPWEFNWYGEWFLKSKLIDIYPSSGAVMVFWTQDHYQAARRNGTTIQDMINQGYIAIVMQNRHTKDEVYKDPKFSAFAKIKGKITNILNHPVKYLLLPGRKTETFFRNNIRNKIIKYFKSKFI